MARAPDRGGRAARDAAATMSMTRFNLSPMLNVSAHRLFSRAVAAVLAVASANLASAQSASQRDTTSAGRIVVLGDSLAVSPSRTQNFPAELQKRLNDAGMRWTVANAGIRGDRTTGGLRRVDSVLTSDTRILILALGANDGLRGVPVATVEKNLSAIIERAQSRDISVLLCGMLVPPRDGWQYAGDFQRLFPRLAAKYQVSLVPFLLNGVALNPDLNGPDGIHPNLAGARRVAEIVWPYLETLVSASTSRLDHLSDPRAGRGARD